MSHPFLTTDMARIHIDELLADAENARTRRHRSPRPSLWRRGRGRAGPKPALSLVGAQPAATTQAATTAAGGDRAA